MKSCTGCLQVKPFSDFSVRNGRPSGYTSRCRRCLAEQRKTPEARAYAAAAVARYRKTEKGRLNTAKHENSEKRRAYKRSPLVVEKKAKYAASQRGKMVQAKADAKRALLPQRIHAKKNYHKTENGQAVYANMRHNRRAFVKGGRVTAQEWANLVALYCGLCAYCGNGGKMTQDHDIPLSRGGKHEISNILPSCQFCNSKKHTKTAAEFMAVLLAGRTMISPVQGRVNLSGLF